MATRRFVIISISALILGGLLVALQFSWAQPQLPGGEGDRQIVAAVAAESVTDYEPDPFQPERVRSSTVRVRTVAVVYADGTVELKPCR